MSPEVPWEGIGRVAESEGGWEAEGSSAWDMLCLGHAQAKSLRNRVLFSQAPQRPLPSHLSLVTHLHDSPRSGTLWRHVGQS